MQSGAVGTVTVNRCPSCHGVFLERADLGNLVEAESDWHANAGMHHTEPLPRITADMTAPPPSKPKARAYIETLFE
jgi:Zn-finger nucleic acid-binding protein